VKIISIDSSINTSSNLPYSSLFAQFFKVYSLSGTALACHDVSVWLLPIYSRITNKAITLFLCLFGPLAERSKLFLLLVSLPS
jgi:hypothetical protein